MRRTPLVFGTDLVVDRTVGLRRRVCPEVLRIRGHHQERLAAVAAFGLDEQAAARQERCLRSSPAASQCSVSSRIFLRLAIFPILLQRLPGDFLGG